MIIENLFLIVEKKKLHIIERNISFPGINAPITFIVSGDTEEYQANIKKFDNTLSVILFALGSRIDDCCFPAGKVWTSSVK